MVEDRSEHVGCCTVRLALVVGRTGRGLLCVVALCIVSFECACSGGDTKIYENRTTRKAKKLVPSVAKPAYLGSVFDGVVGHRVTRVTGDPGEQIPNVGGTWGTVERHHYSIDQAWNADMSLLVINKSNGKHRDLYLDGRTFQVRYARNAPGRDRWHPTKPNLRICVWDNYISLWNVHTDKETVVATFDGYSEFRFGPNKGNPSNDGNRIVVSGLNPQRKLVAFVYDLKAKHKYPDIALVAPIDGRATISPLGNYVVVKGDDDSTQVFDLRGKKVGPYWSEYGRPSHEDLVVDAGGDEVAVGRSKSNPEKWQTIKRRLRDGKVTLLSKRDFSHTSGRNIRQPGWVFASNSDEIVQIALDGRGGVKQLANPRSVYNGYLSEVHAAPSPDGKLVIFASNWGEKKGPISAYVLEIRR